MGKCGFALVGNEDVKVYTLLIYKQKNNIISISTVTSEFEFTLKKSNYCSFVDDQKRVWTVHFHNENDINDFAKMLTQKTGCKILTDISKQNNTTTNLHHEANTEKIHPNENKENTSNSCSVLFMKDDENNKKTNECTSSDLSKTIFTDESEQLCSSKATIEQSSASKATILSRVAKMGQKILNHPKEHGKFY